MRTARSSLHRFAGGLDALQIPGFTGWVVAQILTASGSSSQAVISSWVLIHRHVNGFAVVLVITLTFAPSLVAGSWLGTLSDRFDRRRLLIVTQVAFLLVGACLAVLSACDLTGVADLLALAFVGGVVWAIDSPARQAYVVDLVGPPRLASAVSLYEVAVNASRVIAPATAGLILAGAGVTAAFAFMGLCFVVPIVVLVHLGAIHPGAGAPVPRSHDHDDDRSTSAGLTYARRSPLILGCLVLASLSGVLFNQSVLGSLVAVRTFHLGATGYGLLMATFGVGAIPGALLAGSRLAPLGGGLVAALAVATGAATALIGLAPGAALGDVAMALTGFTSIWLVAAMNTLVQLLSPPALRGRLMGAWAMALPGTMTVTGLLMVAAADVVGPRTAFVGLGGLLAVAGAPLARHGSRSRYPASYP